MAVAKEKVHSIDDYKNHDMPTPEALREELVGKASRDMGKVAIFISLLAVLLLVVFFFGLNQNITSLSQEVKSLGSIRDEVRALGGELAGVSNEVNVMSGKVAELEKLPARTRNMIIGNDLDAMAKKLSYIGGQMEGDNAEKVIQARKLLDELQGDLGK